MIAETPSKNNSVRQSQNTNYQKQFENDQVRFGNPLVFRETLCESGRWIDALKERGRVLKKRGRVLKKRGRVLKKRRLVRGTGGGPLLQKGGGGVFLRRGGGVLKNPVEVLKEFDPLPSTLSV